MTPEKLPMFLNHADLVTLTGYKKGSEQINWLRKNRIPFWLNRVGRPVVLAENLKRKGPEVRLGEVR